MKLSEAILKGCEMTVPTRGRIARETENGIATCALGAALVGVLGMPTTAEALEQTCRFEVFPVLERHPSAFGLTDRNESTTLSMWVWFRNDLYEATREEIAAILAEKGL